VTFRLKDRFHAIETRLILTTEDEKRFTAKNNQDKFFM